MSANTGATTATDLTAADLRRLDKIASGLIDRLNIRPSDLTTELQGETVLANEGWSGNVEQAALAEAKLLSCEDLARIIFVFPNAYLYGVHCGSWLGKYEAGPDMVQKIAATVIVCRIRWMLGVGNADMPSAHQSGVSA